MHVFVEDNISCKNKSVINGLRIKKRSKTTAGLFQPSYRNLQIINNSQKTIPNLKYNSHGTRSPSRHSHIRSGNGGGGGGGGGGGKQRLLRTPRQILLPKSLHDRLTFLTLRLRALRRRRQHSCIDTQSHFIVIGMSTNSVSTTRMKRRFESEPKSDASLKPCWDRMPTIDPRWTSSRQQSTVSTNVCNAIAALGTLKMRREDREVTHKLDLNGGPPKHSHIYKLSSVSQKRHCKVFSHALHMLQ